MLLAIDVGNTNTQFGVFADDCSLISEWRLTTRRDRTVDEMGLMARSLFDRAGVDVGALGGIVAACVVPPLTGVVEAMGQRYFGSRPLIVTPDLVTDMPVLYNPPQDVGADRIVNAVAARDKYGVPAVVVDFGTATTFDVVDAAGAYLGGVIATGVGVSADALFSRAARLPRVEVTRPDQIIGRSTVDSIRSGVFWGYVDLVDGLIERIDGELGVRARVVATGGWAEVLGPACKRIDVVDPTLTLDGLQVIWRRYGSPSL